MGPLSLGQAPFGPLGPCPGFGQTGASSFSPKALREAFFYQEWLFQHPVWQLSRSTIECVTLPHRRTSGQGAAESSVGPAGRINQQTLRPDLLFPSLSGQVPPGPPGPCPGFRQTRPLPFPSRPWERPSHRLSTGVGENPDVGGAEGVRTQRLGPADRAPPTLWQTRSSRPFCPKPGALYGDLSLFVGEVKG